MTSQPRCRVGNSLFRPLIFRSCRSLKKSDCERIAYDFFKKRATSGICSWFEWFTLKNERFAQKKTIFHMFLTVSLPLYVKRANCSCRASLFFKDRRDRFAFVALYKRVTVSELISSVFKQERWERLIFFHNWIDLSLFWSQKPAIRSKIRCSNSQPCQDGGRVCVWAHALSGLGGFKIPMSSRLMAALLLLLLSFLLSPNRSRTIDQSIYRYAVSKRIYSITTRHQAIFLGLKTKEWKTYTVKLFFSSKDVL